MKLSSDDLRALADRLDAMGNNHGDGLVPVVAVAHIAWRGDLQYAEDGDSFGAVTASFDRSLGEFTVEVEGTDLVSSDD